MNTILSRELPELPEVELDHNHWDLTLSASVEMPRRLCLKYYPTRGQFILTATLRGRSRYSMIHACAPIQNCALFRDSGEDAYFSLNVGSTGLDLLLPELEAIRVKFEPLGLKYIRLENPKRPTARIIPLRVTHQEENR